VEETENANKQIVAFLFLCFSFSVLFFSLPPQSSEQTSSFISNFRKYSETLLRKLSKFQENPTS
jgi:predicted PurR-regulated permease PerM